MYYIEIFLIILDEPIYVKSVYAYDGLDERELSFPGDCYIRLLRKDISDAKLYGEEWWEGAYENRIGLFPAIFVQEFGKLSSKSFNDDDDEDVKNDDENEKTIEGSQSFQANETNLADELAQINGQVNVVASPTDIQQVPS